MNVFRLQPDLVQLIRHKIRANGPQPFAWFMEQALYHPKYGYYSSGRAAIGRSGDYFTNVSVGPLFGRLMAAQFAEIWERLCQPDNFAIVEQGAHDGQFARDVMESLRESSPEFFAAVRYQIVEPFPSLQDRQSQTLKSLGSKIEWSSTLQPFTGIHFSNELLDAMPVNLQDKLVGLNDENLVFVEKVEAASCRFPENKTRQDAASTSATLDWVDEIATNLQRGFVLTIDYGFSGSDFREMIQARAKHRLLDSPFEEIGDADITAHINWTEIASRAEKNGLKIAGFTDQHHFLTGIISTWPQLIDSTPSLDSTALSGQVANADGAFKAKRALQTLLHPEMMGRAFQVLAIAKDVDPPPATNVGGAAPLAGFKFARGARTALGL